MSHRATLVGSPSGGSTGKPLIFEVYGAYARICTKWNRMPDGTEFVGIGIQPDILVERTSRDPVAGLDPVLGKALGAIAHSR